jgi:hypothetical protein
MTEPVRVRQRKRKLDLPPLDDTAEGFLSVKRTSYGREESHDERIRVPDLAGTLKGVQPARVRVGGSVTRNLGDYNSARVEVMMELPCLPEIGEMRRVADLISAQIDDIIPTELEKSMVK